MFSRLFHPDLRPVRSRRLADLLRQVHGSLGPAIAVLALAGLAPLRRRSGDGLLVTIIAAWFLAQTAVRALGLYNSGGYARFLVPISPFIALAVPDTVEFPPGTHFAPRFGGHHHRRHVYPVGCHGTPACPLRTGAQ